MKKINEQVKDEKRIFDFINWLIYFIFLLVDFDFYLLS